MVALLGLIQFVCIGLICLYEFKIRSPMVFLWATCFLMFGIMHLLTSLVGDWLYSGAVLMEASVFVILFCALYVLTRIIFLGRTGKINHKDYSYDVLSQKLKEEQVPVRFFTMCAILVFILRLAPYIRFSGNIFSTSWGTLRAYNLGKSYVNFVQITNVAMYMLSGLVAVFWCCGHKNHSVFVGILLAANVIISKNRIEVLPLLCSVIFIFLLKVKRVQIGTILWAVLAGIAVIYIVYGLRVFRHYGTIEVFLEKFDFQDYFSRINEYIITGNGELGLLQNMYYFIRNDNHFANFGEGHSYIRMLLVYIPTRFSFGLKPDDFAISMGAAVGMVAGGSVHPTLFGDCYANLGFAGVLLGIFWAMYGTIMDTLLASQKNWTIKTLEYILMAVSCVIMARGSVYNGFWFTAYGVPGLLILKFLWKNLRVKFGGKVYRIRLSLQSNRRKM